MKKGVNTMENTTKTDQEIVREILNDININGVDNIVESIVRTEEAN